MKKPTTTEYIIIGIALIPAFMAGNIFARLEFKEYKCITDEPVVIKIQPPTAKAYEILCHTHERDYDKELDEKYPDLYKNESI